MQVNAHSILLKFGAHDGRIHRQRMGRRQLIDGLHAHRAILLRDNYTAQVTMVGSLTVCHIGVPPELGCPRQVGVHHLSELSYTDLVVVFAGKERSVGSGDRNTIGSQTLQRYHELADFRWALRKGPSQITHEQCAASCHGGHLEETPSSGHMRERLLLGEVFELSGVGPTDGGRTAATE